MPHRLSITCPIDFSAASLNALRYAAAIAEHGGGQLTVLTVDHPLLAQMDDPPGATRRELSRVVTDVLGVRQAALDVHLAVEVGRPSDEILRIVDERRADLIVMSSHGLTGLRKMFFGSTTERVLRDTRVPVLVTRPGSQGPSCAEEIKALVNRILVPVDLDTTAPRTVQIAADLAIALSAPLLIVHVIEPTRLPFPRRADGQRLDRDRRAQADESLERLAEGLSEGISAETLVAYGDPAEEIARITRDRQAGLVVMPLRANAAGGARVGSVAYRVLCLAPALVLALPGSTLLEGQDQLGDGPAAVSVV